MSLMESLGRESGHGLYREPSQLFQLSTNSSFGPSLLPQEEVSPWLPKINLSMKGTQDFADSDMKNKGEPRT